MSLCSFIPACAVAHHPANVPSARVHVNPDNTLELHVRFDILAFCLEATPQDIANGPMDALLDGPQSELQNRLADAQNRFKSGTVVTTDTGTAAFDSISFPSVSDVLNCAAENGQQRLPVMLTAIVKEHLPAGARTISCRFPDVMGSVVVTAEMPYEEPVSEPVDPGSASTPLQIPTAAQIAQASAQMTTTGSAGVSPASAPSLVPSVAPVTRKEAASAPKISTATSQSAKSSTEIQGPPKPSPSTAKSTATVNIAPTNPQPSATTSATPPVPTPIPLMPVGRPAWYLMFAGYVKMGYKHIIPQGLDHILFVLGLFLLSKKTKALLTQISAFTIAHSITLGLSLYGVFSLPSSIVEPLIALSIVFVAVENLFTTEMKAWRPFVVFGFGLVHGLGFAGALKDAGLAKGDFLTGLVGFNAGVELGQLSVVVLALVAVGWLRSKPSYRMAVVMPASCAIALIALVWTIERIV
jgi:hypothetical protein